MHNEDAPNSPSNHSVQSLHPPTKQRELNASESAPHSLSLALQNCRSVVCRWQWNICAFTGKMKTLNWQKRVELSSLPRVTCLERIRMPFPQVAEQSDQAPHWLTAHSPVGNGRGMDNYSKPIPVHPLLSLYCSSSDVLVTLCASRRYSSSGRHCADTT